MIYLHQKYGFAYLLFNLAYFNLLESLWQRQILWPYFLCENLGQNIEALHNQYLQVGVNLNLQSLSFFFLTKCFLMATDSWCGKGPQEFQEQALGIRKKQRKLYVWIIKDKPAFNIKDKYHVPKEYAKSCCQLHSSPVQSHDNHEE